VGKQFLFTLRITDSIQINCVVKMYNPYIVREVRGLARFFGTHGKKIKMIAPDRSYEL